VDQPVQVDTLLTIPPGSRGKTVFFFSVPAGRRLVVEFVDASIEAPPGQQVPLFFETEVGGSNVQHRLITVPQPLLAVVSQQVRFYADAGRQLKVFASRTSGIGQAKVIFAVSGRLVPIE
jgi:hypothetical protein